MLSWGRLGADVGAVPTLAAPRGGGRAARAAAVARAHRDRAGRPRAGARRAGALDLATGGDAHFTRSVLRAGGLDELARGGAAALRAQLRLARPGRDRPLVVIAMVGAAVGIRHRRACSPRLEDLPGLRAGFWGALAAVVSGALTNDSGPVIFLIGTTYLALAVGYWPGDAGPHGTRRPLGIPVAAESPL